MGLPVKKWHVDSFSFINLYTLSIGLIFGNSSKTKAPNFLKISGVNLILYSSSIILNSFSWSITQWKFSYQCSFVIFILKILLQQSTNKFSD